MGDMLYLAGHDYTDVETKVDLLNGVLRLQRGSWVPQIGSAGQRVTETMDLASEATNAEVLAELARIEGLFELARTWPINPVQAGGAWLEWGIDAEPRGSSEAGYPAKRAWIHEGKAQLVNPRDLPGAFLNQRAAARIAVTRHPYWENPDSLYDDDYSDISFGDVVDMTGLEAEMGTAPARILQLILQEGGGNICQEYWLGLRATNQGWAEFDPLWELEQGTNGTDTSDAVDATASGGNKITCTFATESGLEERVRVSTEQAHAGTTNWDHFHGRYLVLLRAKVGSSTECGVTLRSGMPYDPDLSRLEEVYLDNSSWKLIELGEVTIPPIGFRQEHILITSGDPLANERYFTFAIEAERLTGSGGLDLDCLYLIPADHYLHGWSRYETAVINYMLRLAAVTDPTDRHEFQLINTSNHIWVSGAEFSSRQWHFPVDLALAVVAGQRPGEHRISDTFEFTIDWIPRWHLFRTA